MLLRSFSFGSYMGVDELPAEILELFNSLIECPDKKIEFASEIIQAALQGKIKLDGSFNIDAYEAAIKKNNFLVKDGERKKKLHLDDGSFDDDFTETMYNGCVKTEYLSYDYMSCTDEMKDAFEELLNGEELDYAVSAIKSLNDKVMIEYGVDLIYAVRQAIRGFPQAIGVVKNLCLECKYISDLVEIVLSSDKEFNVLFN